MFLNQQDLIELTGRRRHDAQALQLNKMGIVHKIRADGMPLVLRSYITKEFGGEESRLVKLSSPNWDAVNA